jgi:hypothetical protein
VGGLEGNCNKQALAFMKRLALLKESADEVAAARGGKETLGERLDFLEDLDLGNIAAQRVYSGEALITNRGVISGCTISKSASAVWNISLAAGFFFMDGLELSCKAAANVALVPANYGAETQYCYAYLYLDADGAVHFATTPLGSAVPDGGLPLYRFAIPAGNDGASDPYLAQVTMTDLRRVESGYPIQTNSAVFASVALSENMNDTDYSVLIEVLDFKGGWNQRFSVYPGEKAANGFKLFVDGSLDAVRVRWTALKLIQIQEEEEE